MQFQKYLFLLLICCCSSLFLTAQDIHFTQFNMSPLTLNPALTGDFEGTFRIGGIYRDQHNFVRGRTPGGKGFRTPSFFVDVPIIMIRKRDWLSAGIAVVQDKAGTGGLSNNASLLSASYHLSLDKNSSRYLVAGFQWGNVSRKFNDALDLTFEDGILSGRPSLDITRVEGDGNNYSVVNIGLMYRAMVNKTTDMHIGGVASYITRPNGTISTGGGGNTFKRPLKITFHGQLNRQMNDKISFHPAFIFQNSAGTNEIALQVMGGYLLNLKEEKKLKAKAGLGYRVGDAIQILLGGEYQDWQFGIAYDLNVSGLTPASNLRGGFELAVNKIIKIYKKPGVKPVIFCPDL